MYSNACVYVVDDDPIVRTLVQELGASVGLRVESYASAYDFLAAYDPGQPACLVLDVRLPRLSGPELHQRLVAQKVHMPVIFLSAHGDIPTAVRAIQTGAVDFLEKPVNGQWLLERIQKALSRELELRRTQAQRLEVRRRLDQLTPREREVLEQMVAGRSNKEAAVALGLSTKTIEAHRAKVMSKMEVASLPDLVRQWLLAQDPEPQAATPGEDLRPL